MKILIVEDDEGMVELLAMILRGHEIVVANDGKEAVEKYTAERPDLVLMDIELPTMNGVSATKEIKKIDPKAKVIAVTAYAAQRGREILREGALDVVVKPFKVKDLLERIEKVAKLEL